MASTTSTEQTQSATLSLGGILEKPSFEKRREAALPLLSQLCEVDGNSVVLEAARILAATFAANSLVALEPGQNPISEVDALQLGALASDGQSVFEVHDAEALTPFEDGTTSFQSGLFLRVRNNNGEVVLGALFAETRVLLSEEIRFAELIVQVLEPMLNLHIIGRTYRQVDVLHEFEASEIFVLLADDEGQLAYANEAFRSAIGVQQVNGVSLVDHIWFPDRPAITRPFQSAGAYAGDPLRDAFLVTESGARKRVQWKIHQHESESGNLWLLCGLDRTKEHQLLSDATKELEVTVVPNAGDMRERRTHWRRVFPTTQMIAPSDGNGMPPLKEFYEVKCRDMSPSGFSFFAKTPPECQRIVALFGTDGGARIPLVAEIMHVTPVRQQAGYDYLVGCKYIERLKLG